MKIILSGSKETLALYLKNFFEERGHEVLILHRNPQGDHEASFDALEKGILDGYDVLINFPEKYLLNLKKGPKEYKKNFTETRLWHTELLREAFLKAKNPPKVFISFSSIGYYPKDEESFYKESSENGTDLTGQLVKEWESLSVLSPDCSVRTVILRLGLVLSKSIGILPEIMPIFRWGFGSMVGTGDEAFPWIYLKDLFWLILFFIENEQTSGVYNTVAPQLINTQIFCEALASVMHRRLWFKLPRKYFQKKLGDVGEIVYARSKVYPSRLLKSGFGFRYPAIYPALVDALSGH